MHILMYHGTPSRFAAALEQRLRWMARFFDIVPLRALATPHAGARRRLALTFDDGLRSNVTVAYPILRKLRLTATFFVCPGLIDRGAWLWNHEARQRLRFLDPVPLAAIARDAGVRADVEALIAWMKKLGIEARRRAESLLRDATPKFSPTAAEREEYDLADWRELERLDPSVVEVGSHTMSHSILTSLDAAQVEGEVGESRRAIESRLQRPADLFCYPNGDYDDVSLRAVRRHYRLAVTAETGVASDPHRIPRTAEPGAGLRGLLRLARRLARPPAVSN